MIIGLHGKMGSGKDTVLERLQVLYPDVFMKASFAAALKESACALLGIDLDKLEQLKREDSITLAWLSEDWDVLETVMEPMTMRTFLQRFGTESHRDIFGSEFWVDFAMKRFRPNHKGNFSDWPIRAHGAERVVPVFTDARFENEALAIANEAGDIWHVLGDNDDTGTHASEVVLAARHIDHTIDNTVRDDGFASLDAQLKALVEANEWIRT